MGGDYQVLQNSAFKRPEEDEVMASLHPRISGTQFMPISNQQEEELKQEIEEPEVETELSPVLPKSENIQNARKSLKDKIYEKVCLQNIKTLGYLSKGEINPPRPEPKCDPLPYSQR